MKATEQYFPVVQFVLMLPVEGGFNLLEFVDIIFKHNVPFKWKLLSGTFL